MYAYKLNNSYTIYVNYAYLNECRKKSQKKTSSYTSNKFIDNCITKNTVQIGKFVEIIDVDTNEIEAFTIVNKNDVDINKNNISNESPLGRALIGHKVGEIIKITVPAGIFQYRILKLI